MATAAGDALWLQDNSLVHPSFFVVLQSTGAPLVDTLMKVGSEEGLVVDVPDTAVGVAFGAPLMPVFFFAGTGLPLIGKWVRPTSWAGAYGVLPAPGSGDFPGNIGGLLVVQAFQTGAEVPANYVLCCDTMGRTWVFPVADVTAAAADTTHGVATPSGH